MLHAEFEKSAIRKGVVAYVTAQDSTIAVTSGGNYANHSTVVFLNYVDMKCPRTPTILCFILNK
jgi:hypothetical protein